MRSETLLAIVSAILGIIVGLFIGRSTANPEIVETVRVDTTRVFSVETDTVFREQTDTIYVNLPAPEPVSSRSVYISDIGVDHVIQGGQIELNTYSQTFKDSLLTGILNIEVYGAIKDWDFSYVPNIPEIRTVERESITIERTERVKASGYLFGGGEFRLPVQGATLQVNPILGYHFSSDHEIFYKYNTSSLLTGEGQHYLGLTFPIRF